MEKSYPHLCVSSECIKHVPDMVHSLLPWLTEEGTAATDIAVLGEPDTVACLPGCCVSVAFIPGLLGCDALRASQPAVTPTVTSVFGHL